MKEKPTKSTSPWRPLHKRSLKAPTIYSKRLFYFFSSKSPGKFICFILTQPKAAYISHEWKNKELKVQVWMPLHQEVLNYNSPHQEIIFFACLELKTWRMLYLGFVQNVRWILASDWNIQTITVILQITMKHCSKRCKNSKALTFLDLFGILKKSANRK